MEFNLFKELKRNATNEEFNEALTIATQDIKFNNIGFQKLTKVEEVKNICRRALNLVKGVQAYDEAFKSWWIYIDGKKEISKERENEEVSGNWIWEIHFC